MLSTSEKLVYKHYVFPDAAKDISENIAMQNTGKIILFGNSRHDESVCFEPNRCVHKSNIIMYLKLKLSI